jgi:hypothetical protein
VRRFHRIEASKQIGSFLQELPKNSRSESFIHAAFTPKVIIKAFFVFIKVLIDIKIRQLQKIFEGSWFI